MDMASGQSARQSKRANGTPGSVVRRVASPPALRRSRPGQPTPGSEGSVLAHQPSSRPRPRPAERSPQTLGPQRMEFRAYEDPRLVFQRTSIARAG